MRRFAGNGKSSIDKRKGHCIIHRVNGLNNLLSFIALGSIPRGHDAYAKLAGSITFFFFYFLLYGLHPDWNGRHR